jgi:hypothetical protein
MKRALILLAAAALTSLGCAQEPANLAPNGDFEQLTAQGFAQGWSGGEFGTPGTNVVTDATAAHGGGHSMKLGVNPGSFVTTRTANITVKPSTRYMVTWWCRTESMTRARAYLWLQTNVAQRVIPDADQTGAADWTQHFSEYITREDETSIAPVLTTHDMGGGPSQAWFDDVAIYEGSFPPELEAIYRQRLRKAAGICETALVLAKGGGLTLWADTLAARIYAADGLPEWAKPAEAVRVCAARGEEDYFQLALLPAAELPDVRLVPSDLTGPGTIPAAAVRWWPVGQANIKVAHRPQTRLGPTPDPLLNPTPRTAAAGENCVFCVGIAVPRDAARGEYRGQVAVMSGDRELARAPVSLRIFGFTMPEDPAFRTLITFSPSSFGPWYDRPLEEIEHDICRVLAEHGVRGHGATVVVPATIQDGEVTCDFASVDARISWVMDELHFNAFFLGPMFGGGTSEGWEKHQKWLGMEPLSEEFNRYFPEYMRQVGQHLREKGWLDKAYVYLWDEPEPDYFDKVVALQKLALQGDPDLKIWETTSPANRDFWGVVKAWSVPFSPMHFEVKTVEQRRAAGDEIWVYNIPATLEAAPQLHRLWFWAASRYGARGAQLWQTTFYHGMDPWDQITPEPYKTGRGGTSLYYYDAGQAIMLYPDPDGSGPPLPCLRLKLMKKGIDDFEYLAMLWAALQRRFEAAGVADPAEAARARTRELASTLVPGVGSYEYDTIALERTRLQIAEELEVTLAALGE